jgi:pilus assembly protein Flp/PilA
MLSYIAYITNVLAIRLRGDDRGATAVEYGLLVALIAAVIVGIVATLGGQIAAAFQTIVTALGG